MLFSMGGTLIRKIVNILFGLWLSGCAHPLSNPFNVSEALANVFSDLRKDGAISATDIDKWSAEDTKFDAEILKSQCKSKLADPVVAIIPKSIVLSVREAFNTQGQVETAGLWLISPVLPAEAEAGIQATVTVGQSHMVTLPITFTYVSNIPTLVVSSLKSLGSNDVAMEEQDVGTGVPTSRVVIPSDTKLNNGQRDRVQMLKEHINHLIDSFDPKACT